jgi:hypothetical protein
LRAGHSPPTFLIPVTRTRMPVNEMPAAAKKEGGHSGHPLESQRPHTAEADRQTHMFFATMPDTLQLQVVADALPTQVTSVPSGTTYPGVND